MSWAYHPLLPSAELLSGGPPTQRVRYVNTASVGGDGTTNNTSGSTAAYASIEDALTTEAANLVTANVYLEIYCEGSTDDNWDGTWPAGFTTSLDCYIHIRGNSTTNGRHSGVWDASKYTISNSTYNGAIIPSVANVWIDGIQIESTGNDDARAIGVVIRNVAPAGSYWITNNIIRYNPSGTITTSSANNGIFVDQATGTRKTYIVNNIIYGFTEGGVNLNNQANEELYLYNNTIYGCSYGFNLACYGASDTVRVRNNILYNNAISDYYIESTATNYTTENNVTSDATSPDGASFQSQTVTFEDAGSEDFRLASSDTGAIDRSSDLSGDGNFPFGYDCTGGARAGTWDCGAFEYLATSAATVSHFALLGVG